MARAGRIELRGKVIETPIFMPVGTHATIRHIHHDEVAGMKAPIILGNTFHLLQRPGPEVFKKWGGIHQFMNWPGLVLTDSGGFQIFSLESQRQMKEEGARFKSYYDGSDIFLSPEKSIETQTAINSDIMMVLDECVPSTVDEREARRAMELTHRWAKRLLGSAPTHNPGRYGSRC
jgi:queuine tRNA-ribosyltransferase